MKFIRRIRSLLTVFTAALMLLSSVGLNVDMHFCQGSLKSLSLTGDAKSCAEMANKITCKKSQVTSKKRACCPIDCCKDLAIVSDLSVDQLISTDVLIRSRFLTIQGIDVVEMVKTSLPIDGHLRSPHIHKPPKIIRHIFSVVESYLL